MAGLTGIFDIGKLSLLANQRALQVVSQNLANANTPGYSRQEAVLETTSPIGAGGLQVGTGVTVAHVRRLTDNFLEQQIMLSQQDLGRLQAQANSDVRLEGLFHDSNDQGINHQLNEFFNALRGVAGNPQGQTERTLLLTQAATLAAQFNQADAGLVQLRSDLNRQVSQTITDVNRLTSQIAVLNGKIMEAETPGQAANDLRDQRRQLLNELAQRIAIHTFEDPSGQVQVFVGRGSILIERTGTIPLGTVASAANDGLLSVTYKGDDLTALIGNGSLQGLLVARDVAIPDLQNRLNVLATSLVSEVNRVHVAGYALDGTTGNNFFTPTGVMDAAKNLTVALTDGRKIAASSTQAGLPGENHTALAMIALQSQAQAALGDATMTSYYATTASTVGATAQATRHDLSAQEGIRNQLDSRRGEVSGVSLDEELTRMIQFQRAYQAAARVIVTADELFQTLLDIKR